jgi:hypothetical protein
MYPFFEPFWIIIYTFWLTLILCFFLFVWMLKKLSLKFWFDYLIFKKNLLWYFLWVFFFSRLFYVIWKWHDLKYIKNPFEFFIMSDYNFSLAWALIWFFTVFAILLNIRKEKLDNFIDWFTISLLFVLSVWFIWAFFWWQVYGRETLIGIEILYTHPFTPVPFQIPIFPLAIIYSIMFFILFSTAYIFSMYVQIKWIIWYVWLIAISSTLLIFEFFSWKYDIFKDSIWINLTQTFSLLFIAFCSYRLYLIFNLNENKNQSILKN